MPNPRPPKPSWDLRAADVLAGRTPADAGTLIDLIHAVNPTGRARAPDETADRYALKSRLQSLLVRNFANDIEVVPDPAQPGIIALRHRYRRHDACHVALATLDDDARSWVQREIDLAEPPPAAPSQPSASKPKPAKSSPRTAGDDRSVGDLLRDGEQAQAAYDYDEAQRCFSLAVRASGGSIPAALAFLTFAVDALAADEDALAVEPMLPPPTLAHSGVAVLLAIAAARSGDEPRALRHLLRARDTRAAEPLAILARRAVEQGDADRALRHLRDALARDAAHPELRVLDEAVAKLRASERAPREAELSEHLAAGRDREAEALAGVILGRWPESETARRATGQIEAKQRRAEAIALVAAAEEALGRGESLTAVELLNKALGGPLSTSEREAAVARIQQVEAKARETVTRERAEHAAALVAGADRARGLAAYAELDEAGRALVRARDASPTLGFLDVVLATLPGGRTKPAVEAALALERAAVLADRDAVAAGALLAPHERALERIPLARTLAEGARAAATEDRRRRAVAAFDEAEGALAGDHVVVARELYDRIDLRALPEPYRARTEALHRRIADREQRGRLVRRFERLRTVGSFTAARATALELAAHRDGGDHDRWATEAAAIAEHVKSRHAVKVVDVAGGPELLQHFAFSRWPRTTSAWVVDGRDELIVCIAENAWMFLRVIDTKTGNVVRVVRLAIDDAMSECDVIARPGGVVITGATGVFEFTLPGWELVRRFARDRRRDRGHPFLHRVVPPGTRMLWSTSEDEEGNHVAKVMDVEGEFGGKGYAGGHDLFLVAGPGEPRVALVSPKYDHEDRTKYAVAIFDPRGTQLARFELMRDPKAIAAHPSIGSAVVLTTTHVAGGVELKMFETSARYDVAKEYDVAPNVCPTPAPELACVSGKGLIFVRYTVPDGDAFLLAMRSDGPELPVTELYRVRIPARTTLVHDASGSRAYALADHDGGLSIAELGEEPPLLCDGGPIHALIEPLSRLCWCAQSMDDYGHQQKLFYGHLRFVPPSQRRAAIEQYIAMYGGDALGLYTLVGALLCGNWSDLATEVLPRLQALSPDDPRVPMGELLVLARSRAFPALRAALYAIGPARFEGALLQHYHHLCATAEAELGDLDKAERHLDEARAIPNGHCTYHLDPLTKAIAALRAPVPGDAGIEQPLFRQALVALHAADVALAEGDAAAVITLLERPLIWDLHEAQTLARLASAYLEIACEAPAERFRKALALAAFVECTSCRLGTERREMLAPGMAYSEERMTELSRAAVAWLEGDQGVARAAVWTEA